jgi:hypothetical protein
MPQGYTAKRQTLCKAASTMFPQSHSMLRTMLHRNLHARACSQLLTETIIHE